MDCHKSLVAILTKGLKEMKPNCYLRFLIIGFALLLAIVLTNEIALKNPSVYFGKDDGILFRIAITCFVSALIFFYLNPKVLFFLAGFLAVILSYIYIYIVVFLLSEIIKNDNSGWDMPLIVDQLLSGAVILIFAIFAERRIKRHYN